MREASTKRAPLPLIIALAIAGCSSTAADKHASFEEQSATRQKAPEAPERPGSTVPTPKPAQLAGDPGHNRPPEGKEAPAAPEVERAVSLPDSLELAAAPTFPERPRVAVAFVRAGKLVRRADALRRFQHDFEKDARIEGLDRFGDDAPSQLSLEQLCAHVDKQGALLLLVDARDKDDDADKTTYVLSAKAPWKGLAFLRPKTNEPTGKELIARLVRTSRTGP